MKINDLLHKVYGTNPIDQSSLQPKEALAYGIAGFGQNFICTIIGSYLTIFLTDALLLVLKVLQSVLLQVQWQLHI